jgi:hypothetical protein
MKITSAIRNTVVRKAAKNQKKWSLAVSYWRGQEIYETFAIGNTKAETIKNFFFQYYEGNVPEGARLPSGRNLIFLSWVEFKS